MSPIIHLITAWLIAILLLKDVKARRVVMIAGVIPDIDGVFILFSTDLYYKYHHTFGHSLVFALPFLAVASIYGSKRISTWATTFFVAILAFLAHLISDMFASSWSVYPFWPLNSLGLSAYPMLTKDMLQLVIVPIFSVLVFILMALAIIKKGSTPMEFISGKWDKATTGFFAYPLKYRCSKCQKRASYHCEKCGEYLCARHVNSFFSTTCPDCEASIESDDDPLEQKLD